MIGIEIIGIFIRNIHGFRGNYLILVNAITGFKSDNIANFRILQTVKLRVVMCS